MQQQLRYVLGGMLDPELEARKLRGEQPLSDFNVFVSRTRSTLLSASDAPRSAIRLGLAALTRIALALRLRRDGGGVMLASGEDIGIPLALATLASRKPTQVWMVLHGSYLGSRKFALVASLLRRAQHVHFLCLAESLRAQLIEDFGFPSDRCHNAGYGVDTAFFRPGDASAMKLVLSAGCSHRDYETLVEAMQGLDVTLRIAADSLWRPAPAGVEQAALPSNVQVRSAGDYVGLRALYEAASFVVVPLHPARHACGYAVIAEAMAMGKAVITTRTKAPSDLVVDGQTGLYVEPGDVAGLRTAIRQLLDDPEAARRMGERGAGRMRESFSLDHYAATIEAFIAAAA